MSPMGEDLEVGETSPLLPSNQEPLLTAAQQGDDEPLEEIPPGLTKREQAVAGISCAGFVTSLLSMILETVDSPTVLVSGALGAAVSPYCFFQETKITQCQYLAETNAKIEQELDQLRQSNAQLQTQIQELTGTVSKLEATKDKLETVQKLEGKSLDELEKQLSTTQEILHSMKQNVSSEILRNLFSVVLACDIDGDMLLSNEEIESLIHRLEGIHGVNLKDDLLRKVIIDNERQLDGLMEVARNLLQKDIPEDENIFSVVLEEEATEENA